MSANSRLDMKVLRLKLPPVKGQRPYGVTGRISPLAKPIRAGDTTAIARAHSLLYGFVHDSSGLTADEAHDVVAWHQRHIDSLAPPRSWLRRLFSLPGKRPPTAARNRSTP